ncbi:MAG TPA: hypothetical protein VFL85_03995 [Candidatus Saccharimonadales bacterium]|nr:hypothetical protein [Candidatus Saccharimonadales bacterium]
MYLYKKLSPDSDLWIIAELTSEDMYTLYSVDEGLVVAPDGTTDVSELNLKHAAPLLTLDGNVSVPYMHDYYLFAGKHGI